VNKARIDRIETAVKERFDGESSATDPAGNVRQTMRLLSKSFDIDGAALNELLEALAKTLAAHVPDEEADTYLRAEERAALSVWRERLAGARWPILTAPDLAAYTLALCFVIDWSTMRETGELWKQRGILHEGTPERLAHDAACKRGREWWQWGGWTYCSLPPDWHTQPPGYVPGNFNIRQSIAAALAAVVLE
jgi:hypothetical protein